MAWVAVVGGVVGLGSAALQDRAGRRGADAQQQGNQAAIDEQRRQYDLSRQDQMPWLQAGQNALGLQQQFLSGDYGAALSSPFYAATLQEGFKGLDAGAAADGNLWGGGTDADRIQFGQNAASSQLGNYYNALAGMSGTGQNTAGNLGQLGANAAGQIGGYQNATGQAQASAYANSANAWSNGLGQVAGAFGQWAGNRRPGGG